MKKIVITLLLATAGFCAATAQDTIMGCGPLPNYYQGNFPAHQPGDSLSFSPSEFVHPDYGAVGFQMGDKDGDSLEIYGVAAALVTFTDYMSEYGIQWQYSITYDTTYDHVVESLRLYQMNSTDTFQVGEDLPVHIRTTPVSYYLETGFVAPSPASYQWIPLPVYERYFSAPQTVHGRFMVGMTTKGPGSCEGYYYCTIPVEIAALFAGNGPTQTVYSFYIGDSTNVYTPNTWRDMTWPGTYRFIFPILTPPDTTVTEGDTLIVGGDTLVVGGDTVVFGGDTLVNGDTVVVVDTVVLSDTLVSNDTLIVNGDTIVVYDTIVNYDTIVTYDTIVDNLSLTEHSMLGRLTGVMPNPAAASAKVVSSFGLTMVEAFSLRGERVATLRLPEASLSTTLDVSHWPAGIYLLRIHTPQGTCVKRLTVL